MTRIAALAVALILPGVAFAQPVPAPTEPDLGASGSDAEKSFAGLIDARLGVGMIDEDVFLTVNLGGAFRWWKLGVGLQVPLRLRVGDFDPEDEGVLREEDWDEVSDWTRVLRYVEWGYPHDPVYARLGVLAGTTLGHGTLVDRYYNVIDADHYQTGVQVNLDFDVAGGQTFLDNLIHPSIFGARGFLRPFHLMEDAPDLAKRVTVGMTIVTDFRAPIRPAERPGAPNLRVINEDHDLVTVNDQAFMIGWDIGWELQPLEWFAITPYTDLNLLGQTGGIGYHLGVMMAFNIGDVVRLGTRTEYRAVSGDFAPNYVNSFYEVERIDYLNGRPKLGFMQDRDRAGLDGILHGWHASLDVTVLEVFTVTGLLEDYEGPQNANLMLRLMLPYIAGVRLSAYYAKRNFDEASEAFDLDRGLLVAEVKWKFWGPMFAYGQYSREWRLNDEDPNATNYGTYETINDWDVGIGAEFEF